MQVMELGLAPNTVMIWLVLSCSTAMSLRRCSDTVPNRGPLLIWATCQ
jgi:hypothetical protein